MEVSMSAIIEVLDEVEKNIKDAVHRNLTGIATYRLDNRPHLESALRSVQDAITELLLVR